MTDRMPTSDAAVVRAVLGGDTERFALLVERYQAALYRQALTMGLDPDEALDMVQDALVKAFESLEECREPARIRFWMLRILRNRCLDHLKSAPARRTTSLDTVPGERATSPLLPDRDHERLVLRTSLAGALDALPDEQREAFVLKHLEGVSYEDMSELLGASVSALKMRVHRAREALRSRLLKDGIEGPGVTFGQGSSS